MTFGPEKVAAGVAPEANAMHPTLKDPKTGEPLVNIRKIEEYLLSRVDEMVEKSAERVGLWRQEAVAGAEILDKEMHAVTGILEQAKPLKKEFTEVLRTLRSNVVSEVAQIRKPMEDIRTFFLGETHDKEIARLREFVDLCERLQALKESGFLDSVADTILNLS